jgi:hypothetical protein
MLVHSCATISWELILNNPEILSTKRSRTHNYSKPGTYHLCLETHGGKDVLGTLKRNVMTLNTYGEMLLTALALALHRFGGVQILAMDVRPHLVEMVVVLSGWRLKLRQVIDRLNALKIRAPARRWLRFRRTQTIPLFVGYVKTSSGRRINDVRGERRPVWKRRYKAAVLLDEKQIRQLCAKLDARFATVRFPVHSTSGSGPVLSLLPAVASVVGAMAGVESTDGAALVAPEHRRDTMLLGRALLLTGRITDGDCENADTTGNAEGEGPSATGIRTPWRRICSIEAEGIVNRVDSGARSDS